MLIAALAVVFQGPIFAANPAVLSVEMVPNVTITGDPGNCVLQYASVLGDGQTNWVTLVTDMTLTGATTNWLDYSGVGQAPRFYRAVAATSGAPTNPNPALLVWINAGTFTMGSPASEKDRYDWEGPQTVVTLTRGFWMSKYETTQAEYQSVMGSNPSSFTGDPQRPVEQVTWSDATNYCAKLTERERLAGRLPAGYVYRLPMEAEWGYACRAGTTTRFSYGDDLSYTSLGDYAWYDSNSGGTTHPVGKKLPNAWGLYDMYGNVWEWCQDWYGTYPGGSVTDPRGPSTGSDRVIRGGCWVHDGGNGRTARRFNFSPGFRGSILGFRSVLAPRSVSTDRSRLARQGTSQTSLRSGYWPMALNMENKSPRCGRDYLAGGKKDPKGVASSCVDMDARRMAWDSRWAVGDAKRGCTTDHTHYPEENRSKAAQRRTHSKSRRTLHGPPRIRSVPVSARFGSHPAFKWRAKTHHPAGWDRRPFAVSYPRRPGRDPAGIGGQREWPTKWTGLEGLSRPFMAGVSVCMGAARRPKTGLAGKSGPGTDQPALARFTTVFRMEGPMADGGRHSRRTRWNPRSRWKFAGDCRK